METVNNGDMGTHGLQIWIGLIFRTYHTFAINSNLTLNEVDAMSIQ